MALAVCGAGRLRCWSVGLEAGGWAYGGPRDLIMLVVLIVLGVLVGDRRRRFCAETSRCGREQLFVCGSLASGLAPNVV